MCVSLPLEGEEFSDVDGILVEQIIVIECVSPGVQEYGQRNDYRSIHTTYTFSKKRGWFLRAPSQDAPTNIHNESLA